MTRIVGFIARWEVEGVGIGGGAARGEKEETMRRAEEGGRGGRWAGHDDLPRLRLISDLARKTSRRGGVDQSYKGIFILYRRRRHHHRHHHQPCRAVPCSCIFSFLIYRQGEA